MRPCTLNPRLSAFEAMEGMFSFDATPMVTVGTEMLIHLKPVQRHSWGYHALKARYIGPSLKHYRVIKGITKSGAVRLSDTFKFKHHALTTPIVTPLDRVIKATRDLATSIQGRGDEPPDKLQAIEHLRTLINGNSITTPEQAKNSGVAETPPPNQEPIPEPAPEPVPIAAPVNDCEVIPIFATTCTPDTNDDQQPAQDEDDDEIMQPRYNLRSRTNRVNATIDPSLIPDINIKIPERKYAHGLTAANHALQLWQLNASLKENFPNEKFDGAILDDETGKSLEFRHLIKLDKYRAIWIKSFTNKLGCLAQGIRNIDETDTIDFIPHINVPKDQTITYGQIVCTYRP